MRSRFTEALNIALEHLDAKGAALRIDLDVETKLEVVHQGTGFKGP